MLVVEEHAEVARVTCDLLRSKGLDARWTLDAEIARAMLDEHRPHAVVIDPSHPSHRALAIELCDRAPRLVVIAHCAEPRANAGAVVQSIAFDAFFQKPADPAELLATLLPLVPTH